MMCTKRSVLPVVIVSLTAWALSGSAAIAQAGELLTVGHSVNECEGIQLLSYDDRAFILDTVAKPLHELDLSALRQ
jgi:hypothetical protein